MKLAAAVLFLISCSPLVAQEATFLQEGEPAPFEGILVPADQFDRALQTGVDLQRFKEMYSTCKDTVELYERKDTAVDSLISLTNDLERALDSYKGLTDSLLKMNAHNRKFNYGVFGSVGYITYPDKQYGTMYSIGVYVGF